MNTISDEEFAMLSEEALWLHQQMTVSRMTNALTTTAP
nr:MAG TPA: hypothetical protein [Caudoviricetes sp.]